VARSVDPAKLYTVMFIKTLGPDSGRVRAHGTAQVCLTAVSIVSRTVSGETRARYNDSLAIDFQLGDATIQCGATDTEPAGGFGAVALGAGERGEEALPLVLIVN